MMSAGLRAPASRRNARTSGFCPFRQRSLNRTAGSSPVAGTFGVRLPSLITYLVEPKLLGDTLDGPGELLSPALGRASHLRGDFRPLAALPAQVGDLAFLHV